MHQSAECPAPPYPGNSGELLSDWTLYSATVNRDLDCISYAYQVTGTMAGLISRIRPFTYPEPFLRAFDRARRGALAKSITGYHKNMVRKQYPVLELANQMPVRIWIWPEPRTAHKKGSGYENGIRHIAAILTTRKDWEWAMKANW
jgi:hypothetical protein